MIVAGTLAPYAGNQTKPGAWTQGEIDDWNRAVACADAGHFLPGSRDETCAGCGAVVRSRTDAQGWADTAAEQAAEDRAYRDAQLAEREEAR